MAGASARENDGESLKAWLVSHLAYKWRHGRLRCEQLRVAPAELGGRFVAAAIAGAMMRADGRKYAGFREGEGDHLLHDSQDEFRAGGDVQLLEQAVEMRVGSVRGDAKPVGDCGLVEIVEDGLDDLQLAVGDAEGRGDFKPGPVAEQRGAEQFPWLRQAGSRHGVGTAGLNVAFRRDQMRSLVEGSSSRDA